MGQNTRRATVAVENALAALERYFGPPGESYYLTLVARHKSDPDCSLTVTSEPGDEGLAQAADEIRSLISTGVPIERSVDAR